MFAIIQSGGKQYKVSEGDIIDVELLKEVKDSKISFKDVILFNDGKKTLVGAPIVKGCTVKGELLDEVKGPKVIAFKYKKRKSCHRKVGHRQKYSRVKITAVKTTAAKKEKVEDVA